MLKYFFTIFLSTLMFTGCAATGQKGQVKRQDPWWGEDKMYHFAVAGVIGAASAKVAENHHAGPCEAAAIGISTTFVIGAGKEWYDMKFKKTFFSWKDMVWDLAGGTLGALAVSDCR